MSSAATMRCNRTTAAAKVYLRQVQRHAPAGLYAGPPSTSRAYSPAPPSFALSLCARWRPGRVGTLLQSQPGTYPGCAVPRRRLSCPWRILILMYFSQQPELEYRCISSVPDNRDMSSIGDRIREARKSKGLTQGDLAKRVGLSQGTIGHIEAGRNEGSRYLVRIAAVLGVRPEWLETGRGETAPFWPFPADITPEDYAGLSTDDREEIAAIVRLKLARIAAAKRA
ncbi:hypothetical protein CAL26_09175 [Bordetella genomosp. 9]|uniref:HTH cro/C1-type domain-containing protein n=3 Tax=Alcaligenaceae TaxID=506 RepID=A0A261RG04_9BORD|nr:hypothetical protein CAL26_09175 [Bordetella genomosp. 9]